MTETPATPIEARALRTALDHAIAHLDVTHRHLGLHDRMGAALRCEGCEVLADLERVRALTVADEPAGRPASGVPAPHLNLDGVRWLELDAGHDPARIILTGDLDSLQVLAAHLQPADPDPDCCSGDTCNDLCGTVVAASPALVALGDALREQVAADESHSATVDRLARTIAQLRDPYLCNWRTEVAHSLADWLETHRQDFAEAGSPVRVDSPGDLFHAIRIARAFLDERPEPARRAKCAPCRPGNGCNT